MRVNSRIHSVFPTRSQPVIAHSLPLCLGAPSLPLALFIFIYLYDKIRIKSNNILHLQDRTSRSRPVRCCKSVHVLLGSVLYCLSDACLCVCVCLHAYAQFLSIQTNSSPHRKFTMRKGGNASEFMSVKWYNTRVQSPGRMTDRAEKP